MEYHNDNFRQQLSEFEDKSKKIAKICLQRRNDYRLDYHNPLLDSGPFGVKIYFADMYKTWALYIDQMEYKGFMKAINMPSSSVHDPQYLDEILRTMDRVIERIDCKPRKLKFKSNV